MTTVYVVMVNDRHTDVVAYPFSTPDAAVRYAHKTAHELAGLNQSTPYVHRWSHGPMHDNVWIYHATYGAEGDSVWVVPRTLDETP